MLVIFLVASFIPEIPEQTSGLEWHKTSRSRVHRAKIHLIIKKKFTSSYFFDEFLQEMPEVNTELTETRGACWR